MPGYRHNYLKFYQLPSSNLFTHRMLFFSREATSEIYGPRVYFLILYFQIYFSICLFVYLPLLFSDLYFQKPKNTLLHFILFVIYLSNLLQLISRPRANFWRRYPKGIDNPFNTSGCKYLFFVCRYCLRSVAWFSYWFDNLGLITEGSTYRCYATSSLPLWGNTDVVQANINDLP